MKKVYARIFENSKVVVLKFELIISDFKIKIPKLVRDKISEKVQVQVNINLKQK